VLVISGHHFYPGVSESWQHRDECLRISYAQDDATVARGVKLISAEIRRVFSK